MLKYFCWVLSCARYVCKCVLLSGVSSECLLLSLIPRSYSSNVFSDATERYQMMRFSLQIKRKCWCLYPLCYRIKQKGCSESDIAVKSLTFIPITWLISVRVCYGHLPQTFTSAWQHPACLHFPEIWNHPHCLWSLSRLESGSTAWRWVHTHLHLQW